MSFALLASALSPSFSADVFAKAKLAKTKITLTVGQKKKITIKKKKKKAKYTFKASNKKVSVNKKGVVTAKKAGKTKITVKEKLKKKTKKIGVVTITIKSKVSNKKSIASAQPAATNSGNTGEKPTTAPTASATPTLPPTPTGSPKPTATPRPKENPDYSDLPSGFMNKNEANSGTLEEFYYDSTEVSEGETVKRHARVALPKGYTESKKYPVIYMQHGIFGNEYSLTGDNTQYVAWNAMANDDMKDAIVVFANVCANKEGKGTGFSLEHYKAYDNFINDLTKCLMPAINKKYSTLTGRENTAVCGFSMGGRVSLQIGFERPDLFGYIGAFCPAPGLLPYTMNGVTEPGFYTDSTFTLPSEYLNDTYVQITKGFKDDVVKQHPQSGYDILKKVVDDDRILNATLQHHEKCDGSGYPNGLIGNEIDKYAKLITIVDAYDAITSQRAYRDDQSPFQVAEIYEMEGYQKYDTGYIMTFLDHMVRSHVGDWCMLSDGTRAKIVMINPRSLSRPVVADGERFIDLSKNKTLTIVKIV